MTWKANNIRSRESLSKLRGENYANGLLIDAQQKIIKRKSTQFFWAVVLLCISVLNNILNWIT